MLIAETHHKHKRGIKLYLCSAPYDFNICKPGDSNDVLQENATLIYRLQ